jgi:hypothetical protein
MGRGKRTFFHHGHITLGTVPVARLVKDSSCGDGCLAFKACRPTAIVVGLAIAADPIASPEEARGLLTFEAVGAFAGVATDRRALVGRGHTCGQRGGEMYCDRDGAGSLEEE